VSAQKLIDLASEGASRSGRARVGLINRAVNFAITPVSDEAQWGVPDRWSGPLETLRSRHGDCEDYAILKYVALLEAGISKEDLKIVILKNRLPNEDHAAVAARADGQWLILDNRTLTLVRDVDVARAIPIFVPDDDGVRRFVGSSRDRRRLADSVPATLSLGGPVVRFLLYKRLLRLRAESQSRTKEGLRMMVPLPFQSLARSGR
jgi:hypothetical protein